MNAITKVRFRSKDSASDANANIDRVKIVASSGGTGLVSALPALRLDAYFCLIAKNLQISLKIIWGGRAGSPAYMAGLRFCRVYCLGCATSKLGK